MASEWGQSFSELLLLISHFVTQTTVNTRVETGALADRPKYTVACKAQEQAVHDGFCSGLDVHSAETSDGLTDAALSSSQSKICLGPIC